jgi:hypothetical protein
MPDAHKAAHGSTTSFRSRLPHPLKKKTSFIQSRSQKSLGFDETSISRQRKPLTITKNPGTQETEPQTKTLPRPSAFLTLIPCAHPQEQCLSNGTTTPNIKSRHVLKKKVLGSGSNCKRSEHKSQHCKRIALREYHRVRPLLHHSSFFAQQKYITNLKKI